MAKFLLLVVATVAVVLYVATECEECAAGARTLLRELFRSLF